MRIWPWLCRALSLAALGVSLAGTPACALPTTTQEAPDPGINALDPQPATWWIYLEPTSPDRPRRTIGLEASPEAFQSFYQDVARNYRHMAPLVSDLPEFEPGLERPDLMPNDPRREMMRSAIRAAFGRALQDVALQYADQAFLQHTFLHRLIPHLQAPLPDPTLPPNLVHNYTVIDPDAVARVDRLPGVDTGARTERTPGHSLFGPVRPILFPTSRFQGAVFGFDVRAFSLQTSLARGGGMGPIWATVPMRGRVIEGSVGVSSRGEMFINAWIRY